MTQRRDHFCPHSILKLLLYLSQKPIRKASNWVTHTQGNLKKNSTPSLSISKSNHKSITPKKKSQRIPTVVRTSPRLSLKQKSTNTDTQTVPEPSTIITSKNLSHTYFLQPSSTQSHTEFLQPSYNFNDLTVAYFFNEYEENVDLACRNGDDLIEDEVEDPVYDPDPESGEDDSGSDVDLVDEDEPGYDVLDEGDLDDLSDVDDELKESRLRLKQWNADALKIVAQLQLEAASGKLSGQEKLPESTVNTDLQLSDYDESGDETHTPGNSDEESIPGKRVKDTVPVVNPKSDFNKLKWCVGINFPSTEVFKDCVIRYAVAQGRDLSFDVNDKSHGRKLRVRCKLGCPFKLYGSWDNSSASFVIKSVDPTHTCQRTMESNRQLKSSWLVAQFLDVFKAKPHWPAADIIETVRRAYKVLIKKNFAYKVKYYAHKLLHGSMKEHYSRLGSYIAALEDTNPTSDFILFTNPNVTSNPAVFQRFYVCFDALKQGWLLGCRKILSVDSCFLKTFLGGSINSSCG